MAHIWHCKQVKEVVVHSAHQRQPSSKWKSHKWETASYSCLGRLTASLLLVTLSILLALLSLACLLCTGLRSSYLHLDSSLRRLAEYLVHAVENIEKAQRSKWISKSTTNLALWRLRCSHHNLLPYRNSINSCSTILHKGALRLGSRLLLFLSLHFLVSRVESGLVGLLGFRIIEDHSVAFVMISFFKLVLSCFLLWVFHLLELCLISCGHFFYEFLIAFRTDWCL